jgi:hypothetical protein
VRRPVRRTGLRAFVSHRRGAALRADALHGDVVVMCIGRSDLPGRLLKNSLSLRETSARMHEVEQRMEQLPRAGVRESTKRNCINCHTPSSGPSGHLLPEGEGRRFFQQPARGAACCVPANSAHARAQQAAPSRARVVGADPRVRPGLSEPRAHTRRAHTRVRPYGMRSPDEAQRNPGSRHDLPDSGRRRAVIRAIALARAAARSARMQQARTEQHWIPACAGMTATKRALAGPMPVEA